jgi:hypothetical protein
MKAADNGKVDDGIYPGEADDDARDFERVEALVAPDHDESVNCNCLEHHRINRLLLEIEIANTRAY